MCQLTRNFRTISGRTLQKILFGLFIFHRVLVPLVATLSIEVAQFVFDQY